MNDSTEYGGRGFYEHLDCVGTTVKEGCLSFGKRGALRLESQNLARIMHPDVDWGAIDQLYRVLDRRLYIVRYEG